MGLSFVCFASVYDFKNQDTFGIIIDVIHDAIIVDTNTPSVFAFELFGSGWAWIVGEAINCRDNF